MTLDCAQLRACADLLHDAAAVEMEGALEEGRHQPAYVARLHTVVELEETAADVERRIAKIC